MKRIICFFFLLTLLVAFSSFSQETLTITTYYPAPFGVYNEMRSKRMAVGPNYYDQAQYPSNVGAWADPLDANEIGYYADLIVQRHLGVGTHYPYAELQVKERYKVGGDVNRPRFVLEDQDIMPGRNDTYKFQLTLKSPRTDGQYGLNWYFPVHELEPSFGKFMAVTEAQDIRFLGDVEILGATGIGGDTPERVDKTGLIVEDGITAGGRIEAKTGVRLGNTSDQCNAGNAATHAGLVRYSGGDIKYCDGGYWRTVNARHYTWNSGVGGSLTGVKPTYRPRIKILTGRVSITSGAERIVSWTGTPFVNDSDIKNVVCSTESTGISATCRRRNKNSIRIRVNSGTAVVNFVATGL